jgi:hypothetical protein
MSVASFEVISESISVLYDTITTGEEQQQQQQQQQWLEAVTAAASRLFLTSRRPLVAAGASLLEQLSLLILAFLQSCNCHL